MSHGRFEFMRLNSLCLALALALATASSSAAEVRVGGVLGGQVAAASSGGVAELGVNLSVQGPVNAARDLQLRGTLSAGGQVGPGVQPSQYSPVEGLVPLVRLDLDLLKTGGTLYYGVGVGTGVAFVGGGDSIPYFFLTPVALLNVHGLVGKDFGSYSLEGLVRLGLTLAVALHVSVPLR